MKLSSGFSPVEWRVLVVDEPLHHQGVPLLGPEGVGAVQRDRAAVVGGGGGEDAGQQEVGDPHTGAGGQSQAEKPHVGQPHVGSELRCPGLPVLV